MMLSLTKLEQHVGRMLTISTSHLPPDLRVELDITDEVIAYPLPYGYLMLVRPETGEELEVINRNTREEVVLIQDFARMLCCTWVRFDRDADEVDGLPTYIE